MSSINYDPTPLPKSGILHYGGMPTSLGEIINIKYHFDLIKHQYKEIKLGFYKELWTEALHTESADWPQKKELWDKYLSDIGQLFFSEPPYVLEDKPTKYGGDFGALLKKSQMFPKKAELGHLLCHGQSLSLDNEYIVITTKARQLDRKNFIPLSIKLWKVLNQLSKKYKIVILGEREVEMRKEYGIHNGKVFGIYDQIISSLPSDCIIDLTVPALGETVSDLSKIRQDCLIMKESKFTITIGVGGNFCMATASGGMVIGFRDDNLDLTDKIFNREYTNAIITKNWDYFIQTLENYL